MKRYEIILNNDKKQKEELYQLIDRIKKNGLFLKNSYSYDTIDSYYNYNNKVYIIIYNDNYGYTDSIIELNQTEYIKTDKIWI